MKDIDFDELDKAVNSLMGGVKSKSDQPEAKTLTVTTTLKEGELPEYDNIQHAAEKIGNETLLGPTEKTAVLSGTADDQVNVVSLSETPLEPLTVQEVTEQVKSSSVAETPPVLESISTSKPLLAKAPSGRFMDVMHPSSDMKTAQKSVVVPTPVVSAKPPVVPSIIVPSRQVASVQQVSPPESETVAPHSPPVAEIAHDEKDEPQVLEEPSAPVVPEIPTTPIVPVETSIPQPVAPIEPAPQITEEPKVEEVGVVAEVQPVVPEQVPVEVVEPVEPLSSPFLPDAKVEKRPLGGTDASLLDEADLKSLDSPYAVDNSADTQLTPTDANQTTLPDEFHTDLLAIETNLAEESTKASEREVATSSSVAADSRVSAPNPSVAQDHENDTPENGAIFDTTDYHKSVSHPKKHTSEWVWVAVIVGIILVCGAGAAAFYLLGSQ